MPRHIYGFNNGYCHVMECVCWRLLAMPAPTMYAHISSAGLPLITDVTREAYQSPWIIGQTCSEE